MDINNPDTWTGSYVSLHWAECMKTLQLYSFDAIEHLREESNLMALGVLSKVRAGLFAMRKTGDVYYVPIMICCECAARITAFASFGADCRNASESQRREEALNHLGLAYSIAEALDKEGKLAAKMKEMIADFRSGKSMA